jgi:hypothetical protein
MESGNMLIDLHYVQHLDQDDVYMVSTEKNLQIGNVLRLPFSSCILLDSFVDFAHQHLDFAA